MCGIAGLLLTPAQMVTPDQVQGLLEKLEHRGPDDSGWLFLHNGGVCLGRNGWQKGPADVVLGHRRLSILDLSEYGRQPMGSPDGRYYIVLNGEIYNYVELGSELQCYGRQFRSHSDTEVLLAAYMQWGKGALNRLVGMFAFSVLDVIARRLLLVRDFFGIKPLYYTYWRDGFAFASEIKPLLDLPGVSRRVNPQRLYEYLRFGITDHGTETLFAEIKQVPAAHYLEVSLDHPKAALATRYWQLDSSNRVELSLQSAADRLRELFLDSVRLHLRSDVPVGAALSGGIDSSAIVMAMRQANANADIHAFSYVADDPTISEERWIDTVVRAARVTVHKVTPHPNELASDLEALVGSQEEAFGSTTIYAQRRVFQEAHQAGIKVMLDGQGADEMLGGYKYFVTARLASLVRQRRWTDAWRLTCSVSRSSEVNPLWLWARVMDFLLPPSMQKPLRHLIRKDLVPPWLNPVWFEERGVAIRSLSYTSDKEVLRDSLRHDLLEISLPHLLRYEDRNSMAFSIESRVPFLTPELANFVFSLPEEYIIAPDGTTKAVFRKAMHGIVPDPILERRDKIGFATPEKRWLTVLRPWVERILKSDTAMRLQPLRLEVLQREWEAIVHGKISFDWRVWRWVNIVLWAEKFQATVH